MSAAHLRAQIEAVKKSLRYSFVKGKDDAWITSTLADLLATAGLADIRDLARETQIVEWEIRPKETPPPPVGGDGYSEPAPAPVVAPRVVQFTFEVWWNRRTFQTLRRVRIGRDRLVNFPVKPMPDLNGKRTFTPGMIAILDPRTGDRMTYRVYAQFLGGLIPYFVVVPYVRESPGVFKQIFAGIAPIAPVLSLGLGVFAPGIGTAIGQAIVGAGASAGLATAVGNAALGTILSGGNMRAAVVSAAAGFAGSAAGSKIAMALNSPIAGNIAAAAASSALVGGDPKEAVKRALLTAGAQKSVKG